MKLPVAIKLMSRQLALPGSNFLLMPAIYNTVSLLLANEPAFFLTYLLRSFSSAAIKIQEESVGMFNINIFHVITINIIIIIINIIIIIIIIIIKLLRKILERCPPARRRKGRPRKT